MEALDQPKTLVEQAYDAMLDAICSGTLAPGERLTQDEVARRLNVSRQPITSALTMLKSQGFVREAGRRGVVVAPLDRKFVKDIYEFRSAVEPLAVSLAIPDLTPGDIERGKALIAHGKKMADLNDGQGLIRADMDFHSLIYALSGNGLIQQTMRLNWQHLRRAMGEVLRIPNFSKQVWREHALIFEAMARGEREKAADLMRDHMETAYQKVEPVLAQGGPVKAR